MVLKVNQHKLILLEIKTKKEKKKYELLLRVKENLPS
jgi:hypothetical protein